jgi:diguanylate cyclase (GGDEF)-like protein
LIKRYFAIPDAASHDGRAVLGEQYRSLRDQIPLMYAIMAVNAASLGIATYRSAPLALSLGVPILLCIAAAVRSVLWLKRRQAEPDLERARGYMRGTVISAAVLSLGFGGWGLMLFEDADLVQRMCIGLYIFTGAMSCSFCLQSLPAAGRLVLLCGAMPVTIVMLASNNWFLIGLGINLLFVALLNHRILNANFARLVEVLSSRSRMEMERERARDAEQRAHRLAYHDPLTGLQNRRALGENLDLLMHARGQPIGLLIVDLDRFKAVNDVHGHLAGDYLLRDVSARLVELVGQSGRVYRLGGDEFAVVVEIDEADPDAVRRIARRIVQGMTEPFRSSNLIHHIGASVGISLYPTDADDRETLMRRADIALYQAKEKGRRQHRAFEPMMDAEIKRRSTLESELRAALAAGQFLPFYQPLVDLPSKRIIGYELLARWARDDGEEIGPDQFIPIAEECGLINELMLTLLQRACVEARDWDPALSIAINISPVQLKDPWLAEKILAEATRMNFPPNRLALEITENALIVDADNARRTIESLKNQGMRVALDDFGTGYSSLQHLRMLPFDKIKIDRSFVQALGDDPEALKIVRAITSLAQSLELPVVAEGIESAETAERLQAMGCNEGQGFYFGVPMSADRVTTELRSREPDAQRA